MQLLRYYSKAVIKEIELRNQDKLLLPAEHKLPQKERKDIVEKRQKELGIGLTWIDLRGPGGYAKGMLPALDKNIGAGTSMTLMLVDGAKEDLDGISALWVRLSAETHWIAEGGGKYVERVLRKKLAPEYQYWWEKTNAQKMIVKALSPFIEDRKKVSKMPERLVMVRKNETPFPPEVRVLSQTEKLAIVVSDNEWEKVLRSWKVVMYKPENNDRWFAKHPGVDLQQKDVREKDELPIDRTLSDDEIQKMINDKISDDNPRFPDPYDGVDPKLYPDGKRQWRNVVNDPFMDSKHQHEAQEENVITGFDIAKMKGEAEEWERPRVDGLNEKVKAAREEWRKTHPQSIAEEQK